MKRFLSVILILALLAGSLTGCAGGAAGAADAVSGAVSDAVSGIKGLFGGPSPTPTAAPRPEQEGDYVEGADPLTGETVDGEDRSRPIAVMVQNDKKGYPQWGVGGAEVLVEAISEGKTTSLMALYSGHEGMNFRVGGIGPGRDLFWQMAMPMNSILMNIGSNIYAANLLNTYGYQNLDGHYVGVTAFDLDGEKDKLVGHEYCWYTNQELMESGLDHYGLPKSGDRNSLFNFVSEEETTLTQPAAEPAVNSSDPFEAARIEITFAEGNTIPLLYNEDSGRWEKYDIDWEPHVDGNDAEEDPMEAILDFTNVLVLYCSPGVKDDGYTRDYDLTEGTGLYLNGPTCRLIRWQKADVTQGFTIYDVEGNELPIQVGKSYVAVYGGFDGQEIKVEAPNGDDLTLWDDPEPMPTPEPTPEPEPEEEPEPAPEEEGGAEGEPEPEDQPEEPAEPEGEEPEDATAGGSN